MDAIARKHLSHKSPQTSKRSRSHGPLLRTPNQSSHGQGKMESFFEPIAFVPHSIFKRADAVRQLQRTAPLPEMNPKADAPEEPGLTFVAGFVSLPLLTAGEERSLFLWMNYHRHRAETLRRRWLLDKSPRKLATQIQRELARANQLRNRIVSSNLRLVVSLAKKLSHSLDHMADLISDGVMPLIRSVELFDISLGNRFSTYATWAVRNQMLRSLKRDKSSSAVFGQAPELFLESLPARTADPVEDPAAAVTTLQVLRLMAGLPDRERLVLKARFGLNGEPAGQSLADVAARVGLSKERVRQIVLKSLEELRAQFVDSMEAV